MPSKLKRDRQHAFVAAIAATRTELVARFPACFAPKGSPKKPLALGIATVVIAACPDLNAAVVGRALHAYCFSVSYVRSLKAGVPRIGLDGLPAGTVTEAAASDARGRLRVLTEKFEAARAKRAVQREKTAPAAPDVALAA